ncbi:uncharacterized protein Pyn_25738 [Prunus yedoensis var. nudiflora]|uniref:Uncharacterized protein n=1 Tax=Prunus yedoensis var. nudiflora TaxID=2094558 RepID=A0A314UEY2_PRUYE|nr:uncharacterized protein Pyn_25738 [Prunus yedoensis var. nudiflora]
MAFHTRSNSFPSRPHPVVASVAPTQQALAQEQNEKWTNELLDGSLRLLDICIAAKDALLQTKECVQDLQSIMRRTRGGECGVLTTEVRKYLTSRKMVKKAIHKAIGNVKRSSFSSLNKNNETIAIVSTLRDVEAVTFAVFESHLSFISGPKSQPSRWSLVSKMMQSKKVACEEETEENEFTKVDGVLKSLIGCKTNKSHPQSHLDNLESCIQDQEEQLECLFRQLIKTRVSLLNTLNH